MTKASWVCTLDFTTMVGLMVSVSKAARQVTVSPQSIMPPT